MLRRVVEERSGNGGERNAKLSFAVTLREDPAAANFTEKEDVEKASRMRICEVQVYVDVGMVGTSLDQVCASPLLVHVMTLHDNSGSRLPVHVCTAMLVGYYKLVTREHAAAAVMLDRQPLCSRTSVRCVLLWLGLVCSWCFSKRRRRSVTCRASRAFCNSDRAAH